ncbi:quinone oxidoreductase [Halolactibacillus miurensis]|uniref:Quinone oxidoreductase n=1 Tax=Halolactibacillus miurensis TaxID=306541 RepID=A0A1I6P367_9BACI|nr:MULTISPECIES: YhdH/YhfP family quinone oxidoreductase [Halolactibacillus]GEM03153.1 quinone oxidoreductase [Halolactibacillus miurensis]SFS34520.1 putative quinone oxidoreductase, YhdH/YhfP family [Halolactibacillus miurensis]
MNLFKALVVREENDEVNYDLEDVAVEALSEGDVLIKVAYSSLNYKDMLAVQKNGGVIRNYPMIPGIDLSGTVVRSQHEAYEEGQEVIVTGFELGMTHTGGFAEYAKVPADWLVPLPKGLTLKDAMVFGTAGVTAALSIAALEKNGLRPDNHPEILVTGATGGVGSLALQMLAKSGYPNITALVRKSYQVEIAKKLGATAIIFPEDLGELKRPLNKSKYDYVLDTVGGDVASTIIPQLSYRGSISMCGNAAGIQLTSTVLPLILRGVNILGIDSVNVPITERFELWDKLAGDWNVSQTALVNEVSLTGLKEKITAIKKGEHLGRTIVKFD